MDKIIQVVIGVVVLWLIFEFLIPILPGVLATIATVLVIIFAILWLLRLGGVR